MSSNQPRELFITHVLHTSTQSVNFQLFFLITACAAYRVPTPRCSAPATSYISHRQACRSYISHPNRLLGDHTRERIDGALTSGWSNILHLRSGSSSIKKNYPSNRAGWVLLKQYVSCVDIVVLMANANGISVTGANQWIDTYTEVRQIDLHEKIKRTATN